ncbi:type II toxin-antitoxin system VapC family toxin [Nostocoides vanveenii]|uniref:Ribonuclease VapC n=1 Tax=Nostocoides vanveenii TaxID=330835 RepID=A0ABN2KYQ0_9MICO
MNQRPNLFLDTPVFLYALGKAAPAKAAAQTLLRDASVGQLRLHTGAECVQEVIFHRLRSGSRNLAVNQVHAIRELCVVHPMDDAVLDRGLELIEEAGARGRDAFIAATALLAGFDHIVTTDTRFVDVPGLRPVDPRDLAG